MTDVRVRITKVQRHEAGFYTANVTAAGQDTVRVDTRIGPWTLPADPQDDFTSNQINRREVRMEFAVMLWKRVKALERGEAVADDAPEPAPTPSTTDKIARDMAKAALTAVKEAA